MALDGSAHPTGPEGPPLCRVCLIDEATIVDHGEELRVWYVERDGELQKAREMLAGETAELEGPDDAPAGVVWRRTTELLLPRGTLLMKRVTAPRIERRDPLDYLTRGNLGTYRSVRETYFRIVGNYRLVEEPLRDRPRQG